MNMLKDDIKGATMTPATGLQGRIYALTERDITGVQPKVFEASATEYKEASKAGSVIERRLGVRIQEVQNSIPEYKEAPGRVVLNAIGNEFGHFAAALKAKSEGKYVVVPREDGVTERGIFSGTKEEPKREGMWIEKDKENRVRQIGSFQGGKPNGSFRTFRPDGSAESASYFKEGVQQGAEYQYNEKSEVIHKKEFVDGVEVNAADVDPVKAKEKRAEVAAQKHAMKNLKIGR